MIFISLPWSYLLLCVLGFRSELSFVGNLSWNYHAFDSLMIGDGFSLVKLLHPLSRILNRFHRLVDLLRYHLLLDWTFVYLLSLASLISISLLLKVLVDLLLQRFIMHLLNNLLHRSCFGLVNELYQLLCKFYLIRYCFHQIKYVRALQLGLAHSELQNYCHLLNKEAQYYALLYKSLHGFPHKYFYI